MIPKMNSRDLTNVLTSAQESINDIELEIANIKNDMTKKLIVIKNEQEYAFQQLLNIKEKTGETIEYKNKIVFANTKNMTGTYDIYGTTIHPKFVREPNNVFNFVTSLGPVFKYNNNVRINDKVNEGAKAMLMHDAITGKGIAFDEYDTNQIKLEIEINVEELLGSTQFNTIEICPFLPGSFDINRIELFQIQSYMTQSIAPDYTMSSTIESVGPCRLILDAKYNLYKIVFYITVNYQNKNGKYPFGLKHLYFYDADFDTNSSVTVKIEKNGYVDWVGEDIIVRNQQQKYESSCTKEGIKIYLSESDDGKLEYELETSNGIAQNSVWINTKEIYVFYPLKQSLISLEFLDIGTR